jgi:hypothetical protein
VIVAVLVVLELSLSMAWPRVVSRVALLPQPAATSWYDGCNWHHRYYERAWGFWQVNENSTGRACLG